MTEHANHIELRGRLSTEPLERELPSGDSLVYFRLVVPRSGGVLRRSKQRVDVIECAAWTASAKRQARRFDEGDHVVVTGALRRRFGAGGVSWFSVDLETCVANGSITSVP